MNKKTLEGKTQKAAGRVKQAVGKVADNPRLKGEGRADRAIGAVKASFGKLREKVGEALGQVIGAYDEIQRERSSKPPQRKTRRRPRTA